MTGNSTKPIFAQLPFVKGGQKKPRLRDYRVLIFFLDNRDCNLLSVKVEKTETRFRRYQKTGRHVMDIYEGIEKRRTVRIFKKGATEEQLRRILLAGSKAPSAGNRQSWEFVVIDDPKIIGPLAEIKYQVNRTFAP